MRIWGPRCVIKLTKSKKCRLGRVKARGGPVKGLSGFKAPAFVPLSAMEAADTNTFHSCTQRWGVELDVLTMPEQGDRWERLGWQGAGTHFYQLCVCTVRTINRRCWLCFCRCTNNVNTQKFMSNTCTVCCCPTAQTETETLCLVTMDSSTSPNHQQVITRTWNTCSRILSTLT